MFNDVDMRASLEARGIKIVDRGERPDQPKSPRLIETTYYEYGKNPSKETEVMVTRSTRVDLANRNAFYRLTQNDYGAGVAVIIDKGNYDELCTIITRDINGDINTQFKRNPKRPILTTSL